MASKRAPAAVGPELPDLVCVRLLKSGGFADVYLYRRLSVDANTAVKFMNPDKLTDAQQAQFVAEGKVMAALKGHRSIVSVEGAGTAPDGRPYIVMEYYSAGDLAERAAQEPMSVPDALQIGIRLASAVETAHRAGIIHRDIKPANVLVNEYDDMALTDFGIAGRPDQSEDESETSLSVPWAPKEIIVGHSNGSVQSDVYSLGATIWHLLVGHPPFHIPNGANTYEAMVPRIVHQKPPAIGRNDVPSSLDRLLQQTLAKDPAHRPQTALELARSLQRVEQELKFSPTKIDVLDKPVSPPQPAVTTLPPDELAAPTEMGSPSGVSAPDADELPTQFKPPPQVHAQAPRHAFVPSAEESAQEPPTELRRSPSPAPGSWVMPTAPASLVEIPTDEEPRRERRGVALAGATVLLVLVVVAGVFFTKGGGSGDDGTLPTGAQQTGLGGLQGDDGPPSPPSVKRPAVRCNGNACTVAFSWSKASGATRYNWARSPSQASLRPASGTTAVVHAPRGAGKVCIWVWSEGSQQSRTSSKSCAHV